MTEVKNPGNGFAWCGNVPTPWRAFLSYLEVPSAHILKNQNPETNPKKNNLMQISTKIIWSHPL